MSQNRLLTGRLGYEGREFLVRLLADLSKFERDWPGITFWPGKGRYAAAKRRSFSTAPRARHSSP